MAKDAADNTVVVN